MEIKDVENLALLSRIYLSEEEKKKLLKDMEGILDYVKQIENIKLEDAEVSYPIYNIFREDETGSTTDSAEQIKKQFPASQNGFLKVKKIL